MQAAAPIRLLIITAWLLLAAGCGQMPERPASSADQLDAARAAELVAAGQYLAATDLYRQLAARATSIGQRTDYLLKAAEASLAGGDREGTRAILAELEPLGLGDAQALHARLLQAELLLLERRASDALKVLGEPPRSNAPRDLQVRYHRVRADAYRQMGNLLETANSLQAVDALQTGQQDRLQTQIEILRTLALLNELALTNLQPSPPGVAGGWMQLALIVKAHGGDPYELQIKFGEWLQRFPQHPALPDLLANYQRQLQEQIQAASRIAVLLPQSGTYANVAAAIRDGIMISRFELSDTQRPALRFYDSTDSAGIWPLYSQAVSDGAELVIGPLQKEAVAQLLRAGELPVPVLALNQVTIEAQPTPNLYMYSLSPEDEARQAAERIWLDGGRRPVALAPQGEWGDRVAAAFEERWRGLGEEVAGVGRYDASSHDYTETITTLLQIDRSIARHQEMQRWLGRNLEFEPSRRDDIDAVFLAARPVQAQGIRPQLQFHHAGDLPIYATSHAWQGALTASQVEDLKGVMLADIPWMIGAGMGDSPDRDTVALYLPNSRSGYARLYAMGIDALRLVPHLKRLQSSRYESLDGVTGNLYMDETNQIHRQLVWIALDKEPNVLGYSPRLDLQGGSEPLPPEAPDLTSSNPLP